MTHLIVISHVLQDARFSGGSHAVYGVHRPSEHLLQVLRSAPEPTHQLLGHVTVGVADPAGIQIPVGGAPVTFMPAVPLTGETTAEVVDWRAGLDARRGGGTAHALEGTSVAVVGCGSLGATVALLLAQAGVPRFTLIDSDTVDAVNGSRHPCDLQDLGRQKSDAVADLLRRRGAECISMPVDVCSLEDSALQAIVQESSMVLLATDSPQAQFFVNEVCVQAGICTVVPAAYERACGGEVLLVQPGNGPCLYCATGFRAQAVPAVTVRERRQAYQAADADRLVAEPGLAADIASITAVAAAYSLAVLDPTGSRASLLDQDRAFVLVHGGSTPRGTYAELFRQPFDLLYARVTRDDPCPVCGFQSGVE